MKDSILKVALAQIAPVWLNKEATLKKVVTTIEEAATNEAELVVFGEAFLPGYPFWLAYTDGAAWDLKVNKTVHGHYVANAIQIEAGDLDEVCTIAKKLKIAVYLGIMERPQDRGGHSIYCSLVYIDANGVVQSVHRKLQPTYDERLTWAPGDGHGLRVHPLKKFTVGGLNCWENWMPLARASLYGQGENLHVAVWPGNLNNTQDITRFIARESRSYVISVSSLMQTKDFPKNTPFLDTILEKAPAVLGNGGSCIASPDGEWLIEPVVDKAGLIYAELDFERVYQERQNFDPVGHYSRPDVTKLSVNRERQSTIEIKD
ncbi:carbon-nitrogen hydrolase family protein [Croceivirga sp. JEA036]|uniref:carbon-nitrogen hydrolase family protein n=1 Tax=Croceivirga sp. JEA036 TaxID=2721162 RepID=UPI001438DAC8|nr:carbon-nitrogen hydrolase family protein [Croceivirga sp. JEA036]NJB36724.1 carbon-nitrogen hydrolase family protein [Croceivirga sp. JEA036]